MNYEDVLEKLEAISIKLESYTDYPQAATNNPKRTRKEIREAIKKIKIKRELKQIDKK